MKTEVKRLPFPERLRQLRELKGWTQEVMAKKLDMRQNRYTHFETGYCTPRLAMICRMALVFGITVEELIKGKPAIVADAKNFS